MELESDDDGAIEISDDEVYPSDDDSDPGEAAFRGTQTSRLHPRDLDNFMKLSRVLRLLLREDLTEAQVTHADHLLREYLVELLEVCHSVCASPIVNECHQACADLWAKCHPTEPPLCDTYARIHS